MTVDKRMRLCQNHGMIEPCKAYRVGDDTFLNIEEAKQHAIITLLGEDVSDIVVNRIIASGDEIVSILTMNPKTSRKPRKDKGAKRQPKTEETPEVSTVEGSGKYKGK